METLTVTKEITLVLAPEHLNNVLQGLESLPFGRVKSTFALIEKQIVTQVNPEALKE